MDFEEEKTGKEEAPKECLLSVVLLERDIVPGLKELGVTHRQITKAIGQHPGNWPVAVRHAMNEAVGETQVAEERAVSGRSGDSGGEGTSQACAQENNIKAVPGNI
jgi:hypothetical protein